MIEKSHQQLVVALAENALAQAAPEELVLLGPTSEEYFRDPEAALRPSAEESVGFGIDLVLVTPIVIAIATPAIELLFHMAVEALHDSFPPRLAAWVRRVIHGPAKPGDDGLVTESTVVALTPAQARLVHQTSFKRALELGVEEDRARLLADAVVGGLVIGR